ncbi:MAG TPA: hypothetical protein VJO32_02695 [Ktedonobacteraceae bacterium]|nr:hypothetical protein [Ktedonobacteraceae bacterium]
MDSQQPPKEPVAEEVQQGVVYPPPPSYYENMQLPAELPPLPEKQVAAQAGSVLSPAGRAESYYRPSLTGRPPLYAPGQPHYPGMMPPASAARRQTWIIVAIIGASVLLLCGAGSWALANIFGAVSQQEIGANQVAQDFYQHMLQQDYNGAYADLQISGLTASAFTQDAQSMNAQYGQISSFSIDTTSFNSANSAPNATHWQFTVHVTRQQTTYSVQVPVDSINGSWKITSIDLNKF